MRALSRDPPVVRVRFQRSTRVMSSQPTAIESTGLPSGPRRAAVVFILVTVMLDMLALGMVIPVLPLLIESFEGGNTVAAAEMLGVFGTVWALMQFFAAPVLGSLSDHHGRRPIVLLSNLGLGVDYIFMALAPYARLAVRRPGDLRRHVGECADGVRLHRGRHAG